MPDDHRCPNCGATLPSTAEGLCPACLLKRGLEGDTRGYTAQNTQPDPGRAWTPPAVADLNALFPDLEILELLGRGGMGAVYKARQRSLDRLVALKILPPQIGKDAAFAQRFAREAQAMARLNHPHIVAIHDFGRRGEAPDELYFFLMEYVDGLNLRQLLSAGQVAPKEAVAIVPQICDALQYAHDRGIVHRDIKPENILLNREGQVKIADFGLAKLIGETAAHEAGQVMGTPRYMAPEQSQSAGDVDHRADIYALGVVFYQMLTGELPTEKIEPPSRKVLIDVRLDEVVLRALEKEPQRRYQHASELKTQVETIVTGMDAALAAPPYKSVTHIDADLELDRHHWRYRRSVPLVGARDGKAAIHWPGVFALAIPVLMLVVILKLFMGWEIPSIVLVVFTAWLLRQIARGLALPINQLTPLGTPKGDDDATAARRDRSPGSPSVIWKVTWHAVLLLVMVAVYTYLIPRFVKVYEDFDVELPTLTKIVVAASQHRDFWVVVVGCGMVILMDAGICLLAQRSGKPHVRRIWSTVFLTVTAMTAAVTVFAMVIPGNLFFEPSDPGPAPVNSTSPGSAPPAVTIREPDDQRAFIVNTANPFHAAITAALPQPFLFSAAPNSLRCDEATGEIIAGAADIRPPPPEVDPGPGLISRLQPPRDMILVRVDLAAELARTMLVSRSAASLATPVLSVRRPLSDISAPGGMGMAGAFAADLPVSPIGYIWLNTTGRQRVKITPHDFIRSARDLPLPQLGDGDRLYLYFAVPPNSTIVQYKAGSTSRTLNLQVPPSMPSPSRGEPIVASNVRLNFADPIAQDGSFHSDQGIAFSLGLRSVLQTHPQILLDLFQVGPNGFTLKLQNDHIVISEGKADQEIAAYPWPADQAKFDKVIPLPVQFGETAYTCPVHVELIRHDGSITGSYWFCAYLSGTFPSPEGERAFEVVNLDQSMKFRNSPVREGKEDGVLGIDMNGDGRIASDEKGPELYLPFQLGTHRYRLIVVDPVKLEVIFREAKPPAASMPASGGSQQSMNASTIATEEQILQPFLGDWYDEETAFKVTVSPSGFSVYGPNNKLLATEPLAVKDGSVVSVGEGHDYVFKIERGVLVAIGWEMEGGVKQHRQYHYLREATVQTQSTPEAVILKAAADAARQWVERIDAEAYARSWDEAASYFRRAVTLEQWQASMSSSRGPLGKMISRQLKSAELHTSLPGAPDGQYVIIQYDTEFEHKQKAIETVTPMLEADGTWRVSGYYIK